MPNYRETLKSKKIMAIAIERIQDIEIEDTLLYYYDKEDMDESELVTVKEIVDTYPIIFDELSGVDVKITPENLDKFSFLVRKV